MLVPRIISCKRPPHALRLKVALSEKTMISGTCIEIQTDKFPILPGEDEEVVNDGMYGKALCQYLEKELPSFGVVVNSFCAEDWGWWVDVSENEYNMGLQIYTFEPIGQNPEKYFIKSSVTNAKKWSWSKFKKLDVSAEVTSILDKVENALLHDNDIFIVERHDEFPY